MSAVIHMHEHRMTKRLGMSIAVCLVCKTYGLSTIQAQAVMRKARSDFDRGKSPAMTIADARANARAEAKKRPEIA